MRGSSRISVDASLVVASPAVWFQLQKKLLSRLHQSPAANQRQHGVWRPWFSKVSCFISVRGSGQPCRALALTSAELPAGNVGNSRALSALLFCFAIAIKKLWTHPDRPGGFPSLIHAVQPHVNGLLWISVFLYMSSTYECKGVYTCLWESMSGVEGERFCSSIRFSSGWEERKSSVKHEAVLSCWQFVSSVNEKWVYHFSSGIDTTVLHEKHKFRAPHYI